MNNISEQNFNYLAKIIHSFHNKKRSFRIRGSVSNFALPENIPSTAAFESILRSFIIENNTIVLIIEQTNIVNNEVPVLKIYPFIYEEESIKSLTKKDILEVYSEFSFSVNDRFCNIKDLNLIN